jgi:excinuclease ABC subunit A
MVRGASNLLQRRAVTAPVASAGRPDVIALRGVRHHNLRGFDLDIAKGRLTVITGVSGSGKSTLAFDVLHAEGQRRYVECLSAYARQFVERVDPPQVDDIAGILPSVGLRQGRSIRAARATVATLTELGEYFRLLFAHAAAPDCPRCGGKVARALVADLADALLQTFSGQRAVLAFALPALRGDAARTALQALAQKGFHRAWRSGQTVDLAAALGGGDDSGDEAVMVVADRVRLDAGERARLLDSLQLATAQAGGAAVHAFIEGKAEDQGPWQRTGPTTHGFTPLRAGTGLRCGACGLDVAAPSAHLFSSSSALGACPECNGFGRLADIDWQRVVPDEGKSLNEGAIKPWTTAATADEYGSLLRFCARQAIPLNTPWRDLLPDHRQAILDGEKGRGGFAGLKRWFRWLERRSYKMHVRVLLARYRTYRPCADCQGTRLRPAARAWKVAGLSLPEWLARPVAEVQARIEGYAPGATEARTLHAVLPELHKRVGLLCEVGLPYLTLDRAARTLSGGELQRVQLVAALATGLCQVLYVLDEPSVGLHPRDNERLIAILQRLRAAGNTVVVVEHDPALVLAADAVVDLGPGAGSEGGRLLYHGTPAGLADVAGSLTGQYLSGRAQVVPERLPNARKSKESSADWLCVVRPTARNLQGDDVRLKLGALNVVCGVSGSGKSTLVEEVLYRGLLRRRGETTDEPGACADITGAGGFAGVVLVDQDLPPASSRANCATYLKVWDAVRARLAAEPLSQARGYSEATFSFNREGGRCPVCEGLGQEIVDMQFLSDVAMTCETCEGSRFKREVLDVRHRGLHVAEFLARTVASIAAEFADDPGLSVPMQALRDLGLHYLRLGQPLITLSGGEAQRVKIAWHLTQARTRKSLFLLDEPSTGLHLHDVAVLLRALRQLVAAGNTVVLVEHHLDLVAAADHVVELGPDGGPGGGRVLYQGPPQGLQERLDSPTGTFLRRSRTLVAVADAAALPPAERDPGVLQVRGARVHNLQTIDVDLPRDQMVVLTGLSGSGKSSLAFDVVFAEGQRRFLDTLSPFARQYLPPAERPDVDALRGLPPTVAIAQRTTRGGTRSTVATLTDLWPYLRLLYARCGDQQCPRCNGPVGQQTPVDLARAIAERFPEGPVYVLAPIVRGRKGHHRELIDRAQALGLEWLHVDGSLCASDAVPELRRHTAHDLDWCTGRVAERGPARLAAVRVAVERALQLGDATVVRARTAATTAETWSVRRHCAQCDLGVEPPDPRLFAFNSPAGWCPACEGTGVVRDMPAEDDRVKPKKLRESKQRGDREMKDLQRQGLPDGGEEVLDEARRGDAVCLACNGSRMRNEALAVTLGGRTLADLAAMGPSQVLVAIDALDLPPRSQTIAAPVLRELRARCSFLSAVGLDYLPLGRGAVTLSGGESQRLRLAAQLSSNLCGVLYVLDEPTIGLHAADHQHVLRAFQQLKQRGNGLLVVEHDEATICAADQVVELGPGGGRDGGQVVFQGPVPALLASDSATGRALRNASEKTAQPTRKVAKDHAFVTLHDVTRNNLKGVTVRIPRGRLTVVAGVSGSGKSTLVRDVLAGVGQGLVEANGKVLGDGHGPDLGGIEGLSGIGRIVEVDQSPIGRTPRSCPATYLGVFDAIRTVFEGLPEARVRGLKASAFSFNVDGGRCEACAGAGQLKVEMSFLPAAFVPCETCDGSRYGEPVLGVKHRGATMADVLAMTLQEATDHFAAVPHVAKPLQLACRLGLDYLQLGQGSHTLSGGEAQRIKLTAELARRRRSETLYVLDEPSTGLHMADVAKLLDVLQELVARGDTLVVIEHHLDLVRAADWVVDLGPGAGDAGGKVLWQGPVAGLRKVKESATGRVLLGGKAQ